MKKYILLALLFAAVFSFTACELYGMPLFGSGSGEPAESLPPEPPVNSSADNHKGDVSFFTSVLQPETQDNILGVYVDDYNHDGKNEAYAVTSAGEIADGELHSKGVSLWFVNNEGAKKLLEGDMAHLPEIFSFPDKKLFSIDDYSGKVPVSRVFFVSSGNAFSYGNLGGKLVRKSPDSNDFYSVIAETDAVYNMTSSSYSGDTVKPYYLYFDGNFFCEYGGNILREDQFRAITGADGILTALLEGGYSIDAIMLRDNGIINVNISRLSENGSVLCENVTLKHEDNAVQLIPRGTPENPLANSNDAEAANAIIAEKFASPEKFSYSGSYISASVPDIAVYPEASMGGR